MERHATIAATAALTATARGTRGEPMAGSRPRSHESHWRIHPLTHAGATESWLGATKKQFPPTTRQTIPPRPRAGDALCERWIKGEGQRSATPSLARTPDSLTRPVYALPERVSNALNALITQEANSQKRDLMARIALSPPGRFGPRTVILPAAAPANGRPFLRAPLQERALRSGGWRPASVIRDIRDRGGVQQRPAEHGFLDPAFEESVSRSRARGNHAAAWEACKLTWVGINQSNMRTVRVTSPAFMARNASLTSSSLPVRETISSSLRRPCM